ncbi:acetylornithine deacetylase [Candidatus Purcelliella pentastirinorum]|uniref:acetylornithine deacetylase n=1 Tax=Candidatus Purcelliella pentastirinorum TaxID=472834 RepID=UPI002367D91C|nr:acetylornithine deacetylase [Candidatus Purcelliella pentastirinorum]WDI78779.1 acetylornithine deacetylase [Candidatus Purcelliella pentastirinorum]WDR79913.1 acetylornithine deacetylase [Candidatus Purcelliella pentastirinorum]
MKNKLPSFIDMYNKIINIPSISSSDKKLDTSNKNIINILAEWFNNLGFTIDIQYIPNTKNKFNMLAKSHSGENGLLLSGHTDTVPYDEKQWTKDPFKITEYDNKIYGLGTTDMKGFFVFILEILKNINIKKFKKPLYILATADEETSMSGARHFSDVTSINPNFAIIGEPTELKPINSHKGHISKIIKIKGKSGHSSNPNLGINSIEIMNKIINTLLKLKKKLKTDYNDNTFTVPYPTLNLGHIYGGNAVNRICSYCHLHIDIRTIPNVNTKQINEILNNTLKPINKKWGNIITIQDLNPPIPEFKYNNKYKLLKKIEEILKCKKTKKVNYCTEAPFIQKICPTIILGPGSIKQAHKPNEFIDNSYIKPTKKIFKKIINKFCHIK